MIAPAVFWPSALGSGFLIAGIYTYRHDVLVPSPLRGLGVLALGPVFIAASLAAFAGEHFTQARLLAGLVPKWLPARVFIAYLVGVAHLAAALSLVARRCIRWSAIFLAIMFGLFVLLMDLPGAVAHPAVRLSWILAARQTTFAIGALALFATEVRSLWPRSSSRLVKIARFWSGMVIVFYGIEHILHPEYSPGVPDSKLTSSWVPLPLALAYLTGVLLITFGIAMFVKKYGSSGGKFAGMLMLLLTIILYVPEFFLARSTSQQVTAINFIFDTLLFAGTMLVVANAILACQSKPIAASQTAV